MDFLSSKDHSKWAVGANETNPVVCIGDMNRQVELFLEILNLIQSSQMRRGGGAICLKNPTVWKSFHSLVGQVEPCPRKSKNRSNYIFVLVVMFLFF